MPDWLRYVLQYGSGPALAAAVTALALIGQARMNTGLEKKRIDDSAAARTAQAGEAQKERDHQKDLAAAEREATRTARLDDQAHERELRTDERNAAVAAEQRDYGRRMADSWRVERREAHTALLALLDARDEVVTNASRHTRWSGEGPQDPLPTFEERVLSPDQLREMQAAVAQVRMVGSERSWAAADKVVEILDDVDTTFYLADGTLSWSTHANARKRLDELDSARDEYDQAIREDLGTSAAPAGQPD